MNTAIQIEQSLQVKHALSAVAAIRDHSNEFVPLTNANSNKPIMGVLEQLQVYRLLKKTNRI